MMGRRTGTALVPCTCGELVQGLLDGELFLVSCPIDRYSRVRVSLEPTTHGAVDGPRGGVAQDPALHRSTKARRAAAMTLERLGWGGIPFTLEVDCPVPPSKGFGSSTADVVGAIAASAAAVGVSLDPLEMARLAVAVEPSDGTMFPGLALFDHRTAGRWEPLGPTPPLLVAVLEFEGSVDTLEYNAKLDLDYLRSVEATHREALGMLRQGVRERRYQLIGLATTASAMANQRLLPKPELDQVIALGARFHALGVCAAHSGTALGILFQPEESWNARRTLDEALRRLPGLQGGWVSRMVDGGARVIAAGEMQSAPTSLDRVLGSGL
ncbi:MAG: GHMP family kinase ATP-binding protein [Chloroflexota bacterium]